MKVVVGDYRNNGCRFQGNSSKYLGSGQQRTKRSVDLPKQVGQAPSFALLQSFKLQAQGMERAFLICQLCLNF
jgi:hypothetical protein